MIHVIVALFLGSIFLWIAWKLGVVHVFHALLRDEAAELRRELERVEDELDDIGPAREAEEVVFTELRELLETRRRKLARRLERADRAA